MSVELNTIYNEDCLETMKRMPDNYIDLIVTDPPYGMDYQSSRRIDKFAKIVNDQSLEWLEPFLKEAYRVMKNNSHIYMFCNDFAISEFRNLTEKVGFNPKRALVWVKNNHTSGDLLGDYANKTEFIVFAHKGRKELKGNRDNNVLQFDRVSAMEHPTQKPTEIIKYLLTKSSEEGDIV